MNTSWPVLCVAVLAGVCAQGATLYVSPDGDDGWTGTLRAANGTRTDGPLASLAGARDAVRRLRADHPGEPVEVLFGEGVYEVTETVVFGPQDAGTAEAPIRYAACPGEMPVLQGGRRITNWQAAGAPGLYVADLPEARKGNWRFRQLFANGRRQTRARHPNVDPGDPLRKGFFHVAASKGGWGGTVGCIHNRGDWLKYEVEVPATGEYSFWLYYGARNGGTEWKTFKMDGRTVLIVDDEAPVPLVDLPDTGGWGATRWGRGARVPMTAGRHTFVWKNMQGGGLNIDAFALCSDPDWRPQGTRLVPPANGHMVCVQAENAVATHGPQIQISMGGGDPKEFAYAAAEFRPEWAKAPGAEVHIFQSGSCRAFKEILSIEAVDTEHGIVRVGGREAVANLRGGDRYFVENVREELDSAGEWYLDPVAGKLFFQSGSPIGQLEVVAPVVSELVRFAGDAKADTWVEHITFSGFTVRFTDLTLDDGCGGYGMGTKGVFGWTRVRDCAIENTRFESCGRYALAATGSSRVRFARCAVQDSAEGGVLLVDSDHCQVTDCTMSRLGAVYKHIAGVVLTGQKASDNLVAHNRIEDSARYGISCKNAGFRNLIEANSLERLCTETYDTGGIEVTQGNRTQRSGSAIRGNVVTDVIGYSSSYGKPVYLSWGIYLDSFAGGYTVENNLTVGSSHGIMIQGGQGNKLRNNILVDGRLFQFTFPNFSGNCRDNEFVGNIIYWRTPDARFGTMGKDVEKTLLADRNLWFRTAAPLAGDAGYLAWRKRGFGEHDMVADPLFRNPAGGDFRLRRESPALSLGFRPLDLSNVGPR